MTLADIMILSIVVIIVGLIVYRMIKQRHKSYCEKCAYAKRK